MTNPYQVVRDFEQAVAKFAGADHAVATDSCSSAILLSLLYRGVRGEEVECPRRTYPSVPAAIIHAGGHIVWWEAYTGWSGIYDLDPFDVTDGAKRFRRGMYRSGDALHCLSFHAKKHLPIGRGGMILTDDAEAAAWLRKARFDGRDEVPLHQQQPSRVLGYNCYMLPEQAARGLMLLGAMISSGNDNQPDQVEDPPYPDLSLWPCFNQEK